MANKPPFRIRRLEWQRPIRRKAAPWDEEHGVYLETEVPEHMNVVADWVYEVTGHLGPPVWKTKCDGRDGREALSPEATFYEFFFKTGEQRDAAYKALQDARFGRCDG